MAQGTVVGQESTVKPTSAEQKATEETEASRPTSDALRDPRRGAKRKKGVSIARRYTEPGESGFDRVTWELRKSVITNPDGSVVFKMEGAEIPSEWSQLATDIVVSKYFRKAGIRGDKTLGENSVRHVVYRIAHSIRVAGERMGGYFQTKKDADAFEDELTWMMT